MLDSSEILYICGVEILAQNAVRNERDSARTSQKAVCVCRKKKVRVL